MDSCIRHPRTRSRCCCCTVSARSYLALVHAQDSMKYIHICKSFTYRTISSYPGKFRVCKCTRYRSSYPGKQVTRALSLSNMSLSFSKDLHHWTFSFFPAVQELHSCPHTRDTFATRILASTYSHDTQSEYINIIRSRVKVSLIAGEHSLLTSSRRVKTWNHSVMMSRYSLYYFRNHHRNAHTRASIFKYILYYTPPFDESCAPSCFTEL